MTIFLDHTIVPSKEPAKAAQALASLLGVPWEACKGKFSPVYINDSCTLDFGQRDNFDWHHYCFHVSDNEFNEIFGRIKSANIPYRSTPRGTMDYKINNHSGGQNFYWDDEDGHVWEVLTVSYARK